MKLILLIVCLFLSADSCDIHHAFAQDKPNILWLVSEDNSAEWIRCYGIRDTNTPNLDQLAAEGFRYTHAYSNGPVCANQRSTWITGVHSQSLGTQHMRSTNSIPESVRYYPEALREASYYCANFSKQDYNVGNRSSDDCWNAQGELNWSKLKQKQPFFQVINSGRSHESQAKIKHNKLRYSPEKADLAQYHPDLPEVRNAYARYYDCIENMDEFFGKHIEDLKKSGLYEETIIIYNSDHGGVLPGSKRFLFNKGIHCPLIIRIPEKFKHLWPAQKPGMTVDHMVSFIDMPKTWISLARGKAPETMQGRVFLGPDMDPEREFHFAYRGRMDERQDNQRAIRDKKYLYVRNYMPYFPWGQHIEYLWGNPLAKIWEDHSRSSDDSIFKRFFTAKGMDELYDTQNDPDCVNNLITNPEYKNLLVKMQQELSHWQHQFYDSGLLPEAEIKKRADEHGMTIYEMVRDSKLYPLKAYLEFADLALDPQMGQHEKLFSALENPDSGLRYWGIVGCLLRAEDLRDSKSQIEKLLRDPSDDVRVMAAWTLIKMGETEQSFKCLLDMIHSESPSSLHALNVVDHIGDPAKGMIASLNKKITRDKNIKKLQRYLLNKYSYKVSDELK